jgi:hypothetical protein
MSYSVTRTRMSDLGDDEVRIPKGSWKSEKQGGRPPGRLRLSMVDAHGQVWWTYSALIDYMRSRGEGVMVSCPRSERRRIRASLVTTARRRGMKITTKWMNASHGQWLLVREKR